MNFRKFNRLAALIFSVFFCSPLAMADSPLPPPSMKYFQSPSFTCAAQSIPDQNETLVFKPNHSSINSLNAREEEWTASQWGRQIYVADDCGFIIVMYGGLNLLRLDDRANDTVVFRMYSSSEPDRVLTLSKFYKDLDVLPRTSSHWAWYEVVGWNGSDLTVHTVDGRQVVISQSDFSPVDGN